jgi:lipopolysaccharide/colanic/teichoic acid biosynthesis glycosyltransferase
MREYHFKRAFDFTLAFLGLVLSSPLWLLISLAIYLEDRGPVIFLQKRCGKGGKTFNLVKFRTMKPVKKGDSPHQVVDLPKDPRVTKTGRILRATAMDELPTLINILMGDMSFVGPRPLPLKVEDKDKTLYDNITQVPGYTLRSQIKPGLTGIAQVYAPKEVDHREKFQYDNMYLEKMSFWLDLKLIFLSFWITFRGKWEHRGKKI